MTARTLAILASGSSLALAAAAGRAADAAARTSS